MLCRRFWCIIWVFITQNLLCLWLLDATEELTHTLSMWPIRRSRPGVSKWLRLQFKVVWLIKVERPKDVKVELKLLLYLFFVLACRTGCTGATEDFFSRTIGKLGCICDHFSSTVEPWKVLSLLSETT